MNLSDTAWRERLARLLQNHTYESKSMPGIRRNLSPHHIAALLSDLVPFIERELARAQPAQAGERVMVENDCKPLIRAVREADEAHQKSGGGTNHYVRDCLLPALAANGLRVADNSRPAGSTAPASAEAAARAAARNVCKQIAGNPVLLTSDAVDAIVARAVDHALRATGPVDRAKKTL